MKLVQKTLLILIALFILGCKKDKLDNEFNAFEGKWQWIYTYSRTSIFSDFNTNLRPESTGFEAYVEFTNKGKILFFIDNEKLAETKYQIKDQSKDGTSLNMELDFDIDENGLALSGKRHFGINNDTVNFIGFPYEGYKTSQNTTNSGFYKRVQ